MATKRTITKDEIRESIAKNLHKQRENYEPKLTQQAVAELFNPPVTRAAIAQWEVGDTMPDIDRLAVLSKTFGCTIDALIFGEESTASGDLTPEAIKLARNWSVLPRKNRELIFQLVQTMRFQVVK